MKTADKKACAMENNDMEHPTSIEMIAQSVVGGAIVERESIAVSIISETKAHITGYPAVHRREIMRSDNDKNDSKTTKKKSLFAQQCTMKVDLRPRSSDIASQFNIHRPLDTEEFQIHNNNISTIASMSNAELEQARSEIFEQLDASIIAKLQSRANSKYGKLLEQNKQTLQAISPQSVDDKRSCTAPLLDSTSLRERYFPNESIEHEKLAWMNPSTETEIIDGHIQTPRARSSEASFAEALYGKSVQQTAQTQKDIYRFDFNGKIINTEVSMPAYLGLHHHGDDPDQAGYTLSEIMHLMRSQWPAQRSVSLRLYAAIIRKLYQRFYDIKEEISIKEMIKMMESWVPIRMALDDNNTTVVTDALEVIYVLFGLETKEHIWLCNFEELISTHKGKLHYSVPYYSSTQHQSLPATEKSSVQTHCELFENDIVRGFAATNLSERCRFVMEAFPSIDRKQVLCILLRMARHSITLCTTMSSHLFLRLYDDILTYTTKKINESNYEIPTLFDLLITIAQSSQKATQALYSSGVSTHIIRIIANSIPLLNEEFVIQEAQSLLSSDLRPFPLVFSKAIQFICVMLKRGLGLDILSDLYLLLLKALNRSVELLKQSNRSLPNTEIEHQVIYGIVLIVNLYNAGISDTTLNCVDEGEGMGQFQQFISFFACLRTIIYEDAILWAYLTEHNHKENCIWLLSSILCFTSTLLKSLPEKILQIFLNQPNRLYIDEMLNYCCKSLVENLFRRLTHVPLQINPVTDAIQTPPLIFPGVFPYPTTTQVTDDVDDPTRTVLSVSDLCDCLMHVIEISRVIRADMISLCDQLWPVYSAFFNLSRLNGRASLLHSSTTLFLGQLCLLKFSLLSGHLTANIESYPMKDLVLVYLVALKTCCLATFSQQTLVEQLFIQILFNTSYITLVSSQLGISMFPSLIDGWQDAFMPLVSLSECKGQGDSQVGNEYDSTMSFFKRWRGRSNPPTDAYLLPNHWLLTPLKDLEFVPQIEASRYVATILSLLLFTRECKIQASVEVATTDCSLNSIAPIFVDQRGLYFDDQLESFIHSSILALSNSALITVDNAVSKRSLNVDKLEMDISGLILCYLQDSFHHPLFQLYLFCIFIHPDTPAATYNLIISDLLPIEAFRHFIYSITSKSEAPQLLSVCNNVNTRNQNDVELARQKLRSLMFAGITRSTLDSSNLRSANNQ